jgi:vacuolar-type H+-ATPase subunit D/Vma8
LAPLLIYVGDLQMQVDEAETASTLDRVIDVAEALGGYLAGRKDTSVQVRVPSLRFRESLVKIEKLGDVLHRSVTADDVSEQYSDLEVRLINLKATRQRLQDFLARAGTMADMLTVAHELDKVAAEIEQIEGKMRYLRSRAAFSLITVAVSPRPKQLVKIVETPPPPRDVELPIEWLSRVGVGRLLDLRSR